MEYVLTQQYGNMSLLLCPRRHILWNTFGALVFVHKGDGGGRLTARAHVTVRYVTGGVILLCFVGREKSGSFL